MIRDEINRIITDRNNLLIKLNIIFHSINLLPNYSKNQYSVLSEKVLNQLEKEDDYDRIKAFLKDELTASYGLYPHKFDFEKMINDIFNLWKSAY